jgi:hypothetical protein
VQRYLRIVAEQAPQVRVSAHRDHPDRSIMITEIGIVITRIGHRDHFAGRASSAGRVAKT